MNLELSKYQKLTESEKQEVSKVLFSDFDQEIHIGDYIVKDDYCYIKKVVDIYFQEDMVWPKDNSKDSVKVPKTFLYISVIEVNNWKEVPSKRTDHRADEFISRKTLGVWTKSLEELKVLAEDLISKEDTEDENDDTPETGISTLDSEGFKGRKRSLILAKNELNSIAITANRLMEIKVSSLRAMVERMNKEVKKLSDIIWTLELYMGLKEDILLLQEGKHASDKEPIRLLQERLYMDEELGDPTDNGMDFTNLDLFLEWLLSYSEYFKHPNYELLVPYQKCVRILRIRRESKKYSENPWVNISMNEHNFETFILIRNGECLYYIKTDMKFSEKLFPGESDLMDVYESLKERRNIETAAEEMDNLISMYKRNLVIMQGLIDRTEVFGNLYGKVNFLDGSSINRGEVELVYDFDKSNQISDGDKLFSDWIKESNDLITKGSRVLYISDSYRDSYSSEDRFYKMYTGYNLNSRRSYYVYPSYPERGIYQLLEEPEGGSYHEKGQLYFTYLPSSNWGDRRKNQVSFGVFPKDRDTSIVNYDLLTNRELDWLWKMMHDRRLRRNYLSNMKFLLSLYEFKKSEIEEERPFMELLSNSSGCTEEEVWEAIHWWKTKNKYKRSLMSDNKKAYSMILSKLTGKTIKLERSEIDKLELSEVQMRAMKSTPIIGRYERFEGIYSYCSKTGDSTFGELTINSLKNRKLLKDDLSEVYSKKLVLTDYAKSIGFTCET